MSSIVFTLVRLIIPLRKGKYLHRTTENSLLHFSLDSSGFEHKVRKILYGGKL
jgi:hypothetical protein